MAQVALRPAAAKRVRALAVEWRRWTLARQFLIAGSIVLILGMAAIGFWVNRQIEDGVTQNTAAATALYMESVVAPLVQELAHADRVTPATQKELDAILEHSELGRRIVSFKIWKQGGLIAYSSRPEIIGKTYPPTPNLRGAWKGEVRAEFDSLHDEEDAAERAFRKPLLEMYSPIRERHTGRIIAVGEFYEVADALKQNLYRVTLQSWLVVAAVTLGMLAALSGIVTRGSRIIEGQRLALEDRVDALSTLLAQNEELRTRVQRASHRITEINERNLRQLSADLHDGPAQSMALALLRLDSLEPVVANAVTDGDSANSAADFDVVRDSLRDAINEVREISAGLALPQLDDMCSAAILREVVDAHQRRTGTQVELDIEPTPARLQRSLKICLFRFVQEALNNAFRHAAGVGQKVTFRSETGNIEVEVSDSGPGIAHTAGDGGQGLLGLRERIESLGGTLEICSEPGKGTRLTMRCSIIN